ncbi:MAG: sulfatase-like hydrolase/transferase [Kiritimatiellia bacterium]
MSCRPNVLLFFTDDQRFDTIHALGNSRIHTPHLDALVARGTAFTRAHIPGGTCGAVCMPSRAMLHSGRTLFHLDGVGKEIPPAQTTLGECLQAAGYATFGTGKWHNGRAAFARSFGAGDEIFFGGMGDHWNVPAYHFDPGGNYVRRHPYVADPARSNQVVYRQCDHMELGRHSTDLFTEAASRFVRERADARPFFMYVSLMAPHDPRTMPERFRQMYDPDSIELPENFAPEHPIDTGALRIRDEMLAGFPRQPDEIRRHIAEYYAMITHLDDALGRLLAALEKTGELDNTIIVFAGDNGLALGQHGLLGKQNLYEHSVRVPMLMAGPGVPAGEQRDDLVYLLDIFPTICEMLGLAAPDSVEGRSFAPCLPAGGAGRDTLYLAYGKSIRGVSDGCHKLIEYACGATQLFDLKQDPREMVNLAGEAENVALLAQMRRQLSALAQAWDDRAHPLGGEFWSSRGDLGQAG